MEVIVAEHAGFCFGVTKAVDTVYEQIAKQSDGEMKGNIYTYGPIIHNETVVSDLEKKGVRVVESIDDLKNLATRLEAERKNGISEDNKASGTIVIRSHGVTREVQELIEKTGLEVIDATCPFVQRIHKVVLEESNKGASIIVVGSANHPEVEGIVSYVNGKVFVIDGPESAAKFSESKETNYTVVAQTTFNKKKFQ